MPSSVISGGSVYRGFAGNGAALTVVAKVQCPGARRRAQPISSPIGLAQFMFAWWRPPHTAAPGDAGAGRRSGQRRPNGLPDGVVFPAALGHPHRITAEIRRRTRFAVSRFSFQIGSRTAITSEVWIWFTGCAPSFGIA